MILTVNGALLFIASCLMISHANMVSENLGLPLEKPIVYEELRVKRASFVSDGLLEFQERKVKKSKSEIDPKKRAEAEELLSGYIETDQYYFTFRDGYLSLIRTIGIPSPRSDALLKNRFEELSEQASVISTNEAYQLSTNWLCKLGIDLEKLNSKYKPKITQRTIIPRQTEGILEPIPEPVPLPIFDVQWMGYSDNDLQKKFYQGIVAFVIDGRTKELFDYQCYDGTLFLTPPIRVKTPGELLSIPDEEFLKMDATQKSNLLRRFLPPESFPPQKKAEKTDNHGKNQPIKE